MDGVEERYRVAADGFDAVVRRVGDDQWASPSPCEGWTARDIVAHVVAGHRGVVAMVRGGEGEPAGDAEDPTVAWTEATGAIAALTGDPETLAREVPGPTGPMPVGEIIGKFVTMDVLVHTWDLARAVDADDRLDEDAVRRSFEVMKPMDDMIRRPGTFGPKLEPPAGADVQAEFLSFLGRRV
jgi:uncharacterized protein (TIGR03086 family)